MKRFTKRLVPMLPFALAAMLVAGSAVAQPRPAPIVPPLPAGVTLQAPMLMCPDMTQTEVCRALNNALHPLPAAPVAQPPEDRATRDRRERDRREACYVDRHCADSDNPDACRCACRGALYHLDENGTCYAPSLRQLDGAVNALESIAAGHGQNIRALDTRMRAVETRLNMPAAAPLPYDDSNPVPAAVEAPSPPVVTSTSSTASGRSRRRHQHG